MSRPFKLLAVGAVLIVLAMGFAHQQRQARLADPRRHTGERDIVVLAAEWCGYCEQLRSGLDDAGVSYKLLDVEDGAEGEKAFYALGGRGVPVTVIGQEVVHGYDAPRLTSLLKNLGHEVKLD